ncbi:hypothetical protein L1N85_23190 [Paenibacillus alkaliterrae]|uniref:hypothetical protein n=1 Tax=Paenibacillus alkaliterrae TaxID=320909 RepID=UPI001F22AC5A|nr:hypothetical protein [Paenibacillus alkaliterrae]MCF2941275.1 hypothetical protein [Paenibacillus alkaliterrae]
MNLPNIPLADWIEWLESWLETNFEPLFQLIRLVVGETVNGLEAVLNWIPVLVLILLFTALAWFIGKWKMALFTLLGLLIIENLRTQKQHSENCDARARLHADDAGIRLFATSRHLFLARCCTRRHFIDRRLTHFSISSTGRRTIWPQL